MIFRVAGVTRIVKAARDRLPDRVAIGVLTRTFPPELVDTVIDEAGAREQRKRSLPARLTTYFVLAMWLWREHGYEEVLRQLLDGLSWSGAEEDGPDEADVAWSGSITKARARLGPDPLRLLFARVAGPTGSSDMPGCFWRGRRLSVIDGSTMDVADSDENRAAFDGPSNDGGPGAFPQVRLLVHAECGSKGLLDACFDGYRVAETVLAQRLLGSFGPGMLVMADRQFLSWRLWRDAAATGADLLWRVSDSFTLPVVQRLPDGSYLSRLNPPRKKDGDPITVRVIEHTVTTRDEHGATHSELVLPGHHADRPGCGADRGDPGPVPRTLARRNAAGRGQDRCARRPRRAAAFPEPAGGSAGDVGPVLPLPGPRAPGRRRRTPLPDRP